MHEQLLLEEFRSLRSQIDYQIKEARDLERNVLIAAGLIFAWLANLQTPLFLALPAWIFPFLLALIGRDRANRINLKIDRISEYISEIERSVYSQTAPGMLGWETRILKNRVSSKTGFLGKSQRRFWNSMIVGTFLVLLYGTSIHFRGLATIQKMPMERLPARLPDSLDQTPLQGTKTPRLMRSQ